MKKKTVLITGSTGFVGRHLMHKLAIEDSFEVYLTDRDFAQIFPKTPASLDWLIHLASSHREEEEKMVFEKNEEINSRVVKLLNLCGLRPNILFTSSVHEQGDSFYGRSKMAGAKYLRSICDGWGTSFEKIVFPNLFGPYAKPYHTSVVANFCQDVISGKESFINEVQIKLLYIQEAVHSILRFESKNDFDTTNIFLPKLHSTIEQLHSANLEDPLHLEINSKFELQLLTTITSYY